jgi:hypothetical protein
MENTNKEIHTSLVHDKDELEQILSLQKKNLALNISETDVQTQGFVTLQHNLDTLVNMHELAPSVIIKKDEAVIGYALTMLCECRHLIPGLEAMFANMDKLSWKNRPLTDYRFYVMGQICIDKVFRGLGLVEELYSFHKEVYGSSFDLLVTEIATRNQRSLRAHEKAGFKTIHVYRDELDEWAVVVWDWS